jgi:hypothetical protein
MGWTVSFTPRPLHFVRKLQNWSMLFGEEKRLWPHSRIELPSGGLLALRLVTVSTELSWVVPSFYWLLEYYAYWLVFAKRLLCGRNADSTLRDGVRVNKGSILSSPMSSELSEVIKILCLRLSFDWLISAWNAWKIRRELRHELISQCSLTSVFFF